MDLFLQTHMLVQNKINGQNHDGKNNDDIIQLEIHNCLIFIAKQPRASAVNVGNTFRVNPQQLSARVKLQVEAI